MPEGEPLDDVRWQVDGLGEETAERFTNWISVDGHATNVQLRGDLNEMGGLGVDRPTDPKDEWYRGVALANVQHAALERIEISGSLSNLESEDRAGAEVARSNAINVDRSPEGGVGRRYDRDRQNGAGLRVLHDTAEILLSADAMRSEACRPADLRVSCHVLSVE